MQTPGPYPPLSPAVRMAHNWAQDPGTGVVYENRTRLKQASERLLYLQPQDARGRSKEVAFCHLLTDTEIHAVLRSKRNKGTAYHRKEVAHPATPCSCSVSHTAGAPREQALLPHCVPLSPATRPFFEIFRYIWKIFLTFLETIHVILNSLG